MHSSIRSSFIMLFRIALMTLASTAYGATQSEMSHQMETVALSVISHLEAAQGHSLLSPFKGNRCSVIDSRASWHSEAGWYHYHLPALTALAPLAPVHSKISSGAGQGTLTRGAGTALTMRKHVILPCRASPWFGGPPSLPQLPSDSECTASRAVPLPTARRPSWSG